MYKLNDVNFLNFCVDMSDPNQRQPIDPSKLISGRRAMTHCLCCLKYVCLLLFQVRKVRVVKAINHGLRF
jgi:hypothetical protein